MIDAFKRLPRWVGLSFAFLLGLGALVVSDRAPLWVVPGLWALLVTVEYAFGVRGRELTIYATLTLVLLLAFNISGR